MTLVHAVWELLLGLDMPWRGAADLMVVALFSTIALILLRIVLLRLLAPACRLFLWCGNGSLEIVLWFDYRAIRVARDRYSALPPDRGRFGDHLVESWLPIDRFIRHFADSCGSPTSRTDGTEPANITLSIDSWNSSEEQRPKSNVKAEKTLPNIIIRSIDKVTVLSGLLMCLAPLTFLVCWGNRPAIKGMLLEDWLNDATKALHLLDGWALTGTWAPYDYVARVAANSGRIHVQSSSYHMNKPFVSLNPGQYILVIREPHTKETTLSVRFLTKETVTCEGSISRKALLHRRF